MGATAGHAKHDLESQRGKRGHNQPPQGSRGALVALADVKSQYFVFFWGKSVPTPPFLLFSFAHKRPKLVDLDFFERPFKFRLCRTAHGPAQFVERGAGVEAQHFGDVPRMPLPRNAILKAIF
jgi:hypothetical protein